MYQSAIVFIGLVVIAHRRLSICFVIALYLHILANLCTNRLQLFDQAIYMINWHFLCHSNLDHWCHLENYLFLEMWTYKRESTSWLNLHVKTVRVNLYAIWLVHNLSYDGFVTYLAGHVLNPHGLPCLTCVIVNMLTKWLMVSLLSGSLVHVKTIGVHARWFYMIIRFLTLWIMKWSGIVIILLCGI